MDWQVGCGLTNPTFKEEKDWAKEKKDHHNFYQRKVQKRAVWRYVSAHGMENL